MKKADLNKNGQSFVFFLGAGFTKAIVNTAPTGVEFFSKAFDPNGPFFQDERIERVKRFIERFYYPLPEGYYPRIEDVLSLIDYAIQRKEALSKDYSFGEVISIRNDLIYLIGKVIKDSIEKSPEKNLNMSRDFVENLHKFMWKPTGSNVCTKTDLRVSIISTNYDIIIDNALLEKAKSCNYGVKLRYNIGWDTSPTETNLRPNGSIYWEFYDRKKQQISGEINKGDILLLKIHGSLNWFYCPKCDELDITIGFKGATELTEDQNKFLCVNPYCTSNYEPLLVTPSMLKVYDNFFLRKSWALSEERISESHSLVFIGYSLPEADYHIRSLLTKALAKNDKNLQVLVVEKKPKTDEEKRWSQCVLSRYEMLFGQGKVNFQPIGLTGFLNDWDKFFGNIVDKKSQ